MEGCCFPVSRLCSQCPDECMALTKCSFTDSLRKPKMLSDPETAVICDTSSLNMNKTGEMVPLKQPVETSACQQITSELET